jgi:hypothetical protein
MREADSLELDTVCGSEVGKEDPRLYISLFCNSPSPSKPKALAPSFPFSVFLVDIEYERRELVATRRKNKGTHCSNEKRSTLDGKVVVQESNEKDD